jgi:hypothetical protein
MIEAKDVVVWVNYDPHEVMVKPHSWGCPEDRNGFRQSGWCDPIGAAYSQWQEMSNDQRVRLMLETAIDLAMQGFSMEAVLQAFATVRQFRSLGNRSYPMCRALTQALVGRCLEPNTMSFDELLVKYAGKAA